jgi:hypothetical protein
MFSWLNRVVLVAIRLHLVVLVFAASAQAQATEEPAESGLGSSTASIEELNNQGGDLLVEKYEDVAREYGGFRRSPNLFGPNSSGGSAHPGASMSAMDIGLNPRNPGRAGINLAGRADLQALDLSVDDEISKSSMAPFQNTVSKGGTRTIQNSFLENESERDTYLDSFQTARAIAIMTLSYLDKTVAAGLATSQSQADADTTHQILKEMNKSMSKIARPNRARVFDDQDEKFEICMQGILKTPGTPSAEADRLAPGAVKPFAFIWDPFVQCQLNVPLSKYCGGQQAYDKSRYHFCSCCAESNETVNRSTVVPAGARDRSLVSGEGFSLIDRVFMGVTVPNGWVKFDSKEPGRETNEAYNGGVALTDFATMVRSLYGDILFTPKQGIPATPGGSAPSTGKLTIKMASPLLSIQQWIMAVRNFSEIKEVDPYKRLINGAVKAADAGETCYWENNEGMWLRYCPSFGSSIKWGIEPALRQLIALENDKTSNKLNDYANDTAAYSFTGADGRLQTYQYTNDKGATVTFSRKEAVTQMWVEASLGGVMLSRADLTAMAELAGTSDGERIIESFCDTSAVEAVKRLHRKMVALSNDMLTANRRANTSEKNDVLALIKRVDDQLKAGTEDSRSKVDELLLALDMQRDRRREALRSSLVATGNASGRGAVRGLAHRTFGGAFPN